jgi:hypothetical protein
MAATWPELGCGIRRLLADARCVGSALIAILGFAASDNSVVAQANRPGTAEATTGLDRGATALDRIAFAVDAIESSHGSDPKMWSPNLDGPQGPMQVSAAAAEDAGGGNRFDEQQNRALGRAYLALMYQRYGNWPDAVAAYNWGPGNVDSWIGGGRPYDKLPPAVDRYRIRVLFGVSLVARGLGTGRRQPKRPAADPHNGRAAVERLYVEIMRASDLRPR